MIRKTFQIPLQEGQTLHFLGLGDIHWDTPECDRERLGRFVDWADQQGMRKDLVRIVGVGDYLDFASPTERRTLASSLHETTNLTLDKAHLASLREFLQVISPIKQTFLGLLTGHHYHVFVTRKVLGATWQGRSSDDWLAHQLGCAYLGTGATLFRLKFPHALHLDVLALHGGGGAQTPGGRIQKRIRFAEIAPTAHLVLSGHDNAKLAYPRSGLDFDHGKIKRYVIGTGSFQRAYLDDEPEAGYAERWGLVPADLGVTIVTIRIEQRNGKWRVDYHASV